MIVVVAPASAVASFGWEDFPVITSSKEEAFVFHALEKSASCTDTASDETATTVEWCDDDSIVSELADEDEETGTSSSLAAISDASVSFIVKPRRRVCFGKVHIRQHNVVVGVHPLALGGYPLELGWEYTESAGSCSVDVYEQERSQRSALRRLSPLERRFKLAEMSGESILQVAQEEMHLLAGQGDKAPLGSMRKHHASFTQLSDLISS